MIAVFVDTGAWYALSVVKDPDHLAAVEFASSNSEQFVTSDFVYDELLTLFRPRGQLQFAKQWVELIRLQTWRVVSVSQADLQQATDVFFRYSDKRWSFTDCTSRVVMERLGIRQAFAFDDHFRQFGTVVVVP